MTDDADLAARAVILSGSYMLYGATSPRPGPEVFERVKYDTPNISGRMDNLRAAILRPQLARLPDQVAAWNARYRAVEAGLRDTPGFAGDRAARGRGVRRARRSSSCCRVGTPRRCRRFVARCKARGVELKWFGAAEPVGFHVEI